MNVLKIYFPQILAFSVFAAIVLSGINPPAGTAVWRVEIVWCVVYFVSLALAFPRFRFSNLAYFFAAIWCILQTIGAHYSFENVPFFETLSELGRNHFDRLAHFTVGLNALLICEFVFRKKLTNGVNVACIFGFVAIVALAGVWEIIEWIYAEIDGGETGAAFLGSQGDIWDAQKDILCDTFGGLVAAIIFRLRTRES
ncbi:MAG: DUF2238 domain-containing protein [Opitutales bacterium]|nr:DUF2238 domain-containing protein [Opitutales bacterium]